MLDWDWQVIFIRKCFEKTGKVEMAFMRDDAVSTLYFLQLINNIAAVLTLCIVNSIRCVRGSF